MHEANAHLYNLILCIRMCMCAKKIRLVYVNPYFKVYQGGQRIIQKDDSCLNPRAGGLRMN